MNMMSAIEPKSDQMNSDDLIAGPRTIRIRDVKVAESGEQRVAVFYDGDNNKPWKPCKSMSRVLVDAWGPDSSVYTGRSLTLYRDADVTWGGMKVGGIRISHMSHIERDRSMALTATKGKKAIHTVRVLKEQPAPNTDEANAIMAKMEAAQTLEELEAISASFRDQVKALPPELRKIVVTCFNGAKHGFTNQKQNDDTFTVDLPSAAVQP